MRHRFSLILAALVCWATAYLFVLPRAVYELQGIGINPRSLCNDLATLARHSPAAALTQALVLAGALLFITGAVRLVGERRKRNRTPA